MLIRQVSVVTLLACVFAVGAGCGGTQPPPDTPEADLEPPPPPPEPDALPKGHAWRYQVMEIMSPGLGAFLQRVDVKEQLDGSEFRGFRIVQMRGDPEFWEGADLRVGDVVTSVNGSPIGHYDQAYRVWQSLATAPEIVIAYERRGEPKQFRIVVHEDDESPEAVKKAAANPPAAEPAPAPEPPEKQDDTKKP